jgi:hypothetical protein
MNKVIAVAIGILVAGQAVSFAQEKGRQEIRFIDEDGDGINDVLKDHDGDGIPNRQDPDWTKPKKGDGPKAGNGFGQDAAGTGRGGLQAGELNRASFGKGAFRGGRPGWAGLGTGTGISEAAGPKGRMIRWGRG